MSKWRDFLNSPYNPPLWAQAVAAIIVFGVLTPFVFLPMATWFGETIVGGLFDWTATALGLGE